MSPCGSLCNSLRSQMLQPICKFRSDQDSNPGTNTLPGTPIPLDQSNLVQSLKRLQACVKAARAIYRSPRL
ncbi:hypothetical protein YC2023_123922 [Brassica napus]